MSKKILLAHGAGGRASYELLKSLFLPLLGNEILNLLDDGALLSVDSCRIAFSTDSYVVNPPFFPGGDIGKLSICGTVNDLSVMGARPLAISAAFILEEGFPMEELERVVRSMAQVAEEIGVRVVTGDTKVVERGAAQGIFVTTSGIGLIPEGVLLSGSRVRPGDVVLLSGPIGDHEIAVLLARGEFSLQGELISDCAPLWDLVERILGVTRDVHAMRDPTRGGLATALWEIARSSGVGILLEEERIPIRPEVRNVCDLLGYDPYYLASEGRLLAFVPKEEAERVLEAMKGHPLGTEASIIGLVTSENPGKVLLQTRVGGHRLLEPLTGGQFPRIC